VYYTGSGVYLIDSEIADLSYGMAVSISLGTILASWLVYDFIWASGLSEKGWFSVMISFLLLFGIIWWFHQWFGSRAAYIHVGAVMGTLMVGNVWRRIIPSQTKLVEAVKAGETSEASLGIKAKQRSLHNNYMTLPVVFIMISNHFPSTFGHEFNWIVLMGISLASAGIKHYWNLLDKGIVRKKILLISVIGLFSIALVTSPLFEKDEASVPVSFDEVNIIIQERCIQCHSASPTDDQWTSAPNGVMYDTPEQIKAMTDKIMSRTIRSKSMPLGNKTKMTDEERKKLKHWILQGALIEK
jgi:uncharacterized membrane protein